ncbi:MAG: hypothetical protein WCS42_26165 [Verrucomicrobiota bacterium]
MAGAENEKAPVKKGANRILNRSKNIQKRGKSAIAKPKIWHGYFWDYFQNKMQAGMQSLTRQQFIAKPQT